ncbi:hypothetical protein AS160_00550 [Marinitoga sp. 38H-ov]|nr:hypothetical protein AS160_00550 [Marinitoga sp. 38H-ov]
MMRKNLFSWINEDIYIIMKSFKLNKKILLPIMMGVVFVILYGNFNILIFLISLIAFFDFNTLYIPDILNYSLIIFGLINSNFINMIISIIIFFILLPYSKKDKLGFGDIKLIFGLTLYYGYYIFYIIIFSVILSLIFSKKEKIPLGFYLYWGVVIENIWFFNFKPFSFF